MEVKVKSKLTDVSETFLITLWAKAVETKREAPIIRKVKRFRGKPWTLDKKVVHLHRLA